MPRNLTLMTDLYELTMAQGYWQQGKADAQACFYVFFRENPFDGGYAVLCGLDQVVRLAEQFAITDDDITYLADLPAPGGGALFDPAFLEWLAATPLTVDIDAPAEGSVVFPREPLVRVTGSLLQCQLLEPAILNGVNFQTLIATKAARICRAAQGRPVSEFGLRRAQGPDGAMSASRAAFVGGCANVANVLAGKEYGIPVSGTHAHSWVMAFDDELEAFRAYARAFPNNAVLLVDTYDVERGVQNAIIVAREMRARGEKLLAVRIDSGDLAWLSKKARAMLDAAGFPEVGIVLSNDLDEYTITSLNEQGASYTALGVGTHLSCGFGQPALGGVYKLAAIRESGGAWQPRMKVSENTWKVTIPGVLDTRRYYHDDGSFAGDLIFDTCAPVPLEPVAVNPLDETSRKRFAAGLASEDMLRPLVRGGRSVPGCELSAAAAQSRCKEQLGKLDSSIQRFMNPHSYPAGIESGLYERRTQMIMSLRGLD